MSASPANGHVFTKYYERQPSNWICAERMEKILVNLYS